MCAQARSRLATAPDDDYLAGVVAALRWSVAEVAEEPVTTARHAHPPTEDEVRHELGRLRAFLDRFAGGTVPPEYRRGAVAALAWARAESVALPTSSRALA